MRHGKYSTTGPRRESSEGETRRRPSDGNRHRPQPCPSGAPSWDTLRPYPECSGSISSWQGRRKRMKRTIMFCTTVVCSIVGRACPEIATRHLAVFLALVGLCLGGLMGTAAAKPHHKPTISFDMVVSGGAATCLPHARGHVKITSLGPVEEMEVEVEGLPPNTDFDFFVIQLPKAPFGLSWYQGDIDTDDE